MSISQDERERAVCRSRRKFQMDMESDKATVDARARIEIAKNLLAMGMPISQIADATKLSIGEIESLNGKN